MVLALVPAAAKLTWPKGLTRLDVVQVSLTRRDLLRPLAGFVPAGWQNVEKQRERALAKARAQARPAPCPRETAAGATAEGPPGADDRDGKEEALVGAGAGAQSSGAEAGEGQGHTAGAEEVLVVPAVDSIATSVIN